MKALSQTQNILYKNELWKACFVNYFYSHIKKITSNYFCFIKAILIPKAIITKPDTFCLIDVNELFRTSNLFRLPITKISMDS